MSSAASDLDSPSEPFINGLSQPSGFSQCPSTAISLAAPTSTDPFFNDDGHNSGRFLQDGQIGPRPPQRPPDPMAAPPASTAAPEITAAPVSLHGGSQVHDGHSQRPLILNGQANYSGSWHPVPLPALLASAPLFFNPRKRPAASRPPLGALGSTPGSGYSRDQACPDLFSSPGRSSPLLADTSYMQRYFILRRAK